MSRPSAAAASPAPALDGGVIPEEILEEILLRLPPQPSSFPRASLVCTRWRRILSIPSFHRRFPEHHSRNKPPPLLGFFDKDSRTEHPPVFNPTMGRRDRIPPTRFSSPWRRGEGWAFLGFRHGLALLICRARREAVVWDPLTGHQRRIAFPPGFGKEQGRSFRNAAVMCTAAAQDGHVHGDCRFTPFRLALVGVDSNCTHKFACLYESESGVWGDIVSVATRRSTRVANPSVLIRDSFCWLLSRGAILEFDFQSQSLAVTKKPTDAPVTNYYDYDQYDRSSYLVVRTEHNGLGLAVLSEPDYVIKIIQLWERKSNCDDVVGWELQKTIQLDVLILPRPWCMGRKVMMQGYDEDTNAIFLSTLFGDYMLQLESTQFINLNEIQRPDLSSRICYPYRNFYITGSGDGDQDAGAGMPMH